MSMSIKLIKPSYHDVKMQIESQVWETENVWELTIVSIEGKREGHSNRIKGEMQARQN